MNIIWHGQSCFQISSSQTKNNHVNIVIDPFSEETGLRIPKLEADIVLVTHQHSDHNNVKAISGNPFVVSGPGEYEIKEVFVHGTSSFHDSSLGKERGNNTIYTIEAEDLRICHLGDLGQKELTPEQVEKIGEVDILMIPVGGVFTLSAKEAMKIMSQIEPNIIIPMHYQLPKLKMKLDGLDKFLKTMGIKKIDSMPKLSIKKKDIISEEAKIVVLNP
ncbi:MAG: MBL fold metallo-hydrolase [Candidatus Nealsonbacteria bacterium]|nr:MBL fold metallo-hydrolase [Candidatus Nealsonbacteria bacterium]